MSVLVGSGDPLTLAFIRKAEYAHPTETGYGSQMMRETEIIPSASKAPTKSPIRNLL